MKKAILLFSIFFSLGLSAQTDVYFNINHYLGSTPFAFNNTATNSLSEDFNVTRLQYYVAEIKLTHDGGTETLIPNLWILVDAASPVNQFLGNLNITDLEGVEFGIGVENAFNHLDPAANSTTHPLGPKSPSMHWGWSSGYRFLAMEGKTGNNMNISYEIHALGDANYTYVSLATTGSKTGTEININLDADYEMALKGISVSSGPISHGETGISATALDNFNSDVFSISTSSPTGVEHFESSLDIQLFPNPSSGIVHIKFNENVTEKMEVVIFNTSGQIVIRKQISNITPSFVTIPKGGLYLVNVLIDGHRITQKRVVISQ
jgi:hypothetical protein